MDIITEGELFDKLENTFYIDVSKGNHSGIVGICEIIPGTTNYLYQEWERHSTYKESFWVRIV